MDSRRSIFEKESNFMYQTVTEIDNNDFHYILADYGQEAYQSFQEQLQLFDFEKYVEETLSKSAKICEDKLEAEKAMATEKFFKEAYDNLLNMECYPSDINGEDAEELRKATDKFLEESYNNLLHMFDGVSKTTGGRKKVKEKTERKKKCLKAKEEGELLNVHVDFKEDL